MRLNGLLVPFFADNETDPVMTSLDPPSNVVNIEAGEKSDDVCSLTTPCDNGGSCSNVFFNDFK